MENYFNYFTDIEDHFQKKRASLRLFSPIDWALIESFQEAGIPLEVVLRGIDLSFEKKARRKPGPDKINSLSYCTQAILSEFEKHQQSMAGQHSAPSSTLSAEPSEKELIVSLLEKAGQQLRQAAEGEAARVISASLLSGAMESLDKIRQELAVAASPDFATIDLRLTTLEEKILAALQVGLCEEELLDLRQHISAELIRHRGGLKAEQLALLEKKMLNKRLLEKFQLPRLNLFYLPLN